MPTHLLTDRGVGSLAPPQSGAFVEHWDTILPGFGVRVFRSSGARMFFLRYRAHGVQRRVSLGEYGLEPPCLTLAAARDKARQLLMTVGDLDIDPMTQRETARRNTFARLAETYLTEHAKRRKRSWKEDQRLINKELLPAFGERPVTTITRDEVRTLIGAIADRPAPIAANRVLALIRKILNFGIGREQLSANPAARLEMPGDETPRDRVLTDGELATLWRNLSRLRAPLADIVRVRALTGQRGGEVLAMEWAHLDLAHSLWTIPRESYKTKRPHAVPLSPPVIAIIEARRKIVPKSCPHVFANADGVLVLERVRKLRMGRLLVPAKTRKADVPDVRGHDLRRTMASRLGDLGVAREIIAAVLGHVDASVTGRVYDLSARLPEKRAALEKWAEHVLRVVAANSPPPMQAQKRTAAATRRGAGRAVS